MLLHGATSYFSTHCFIIRVLPFIMLVTRIIRLSVYLLLILGLLPALLLPFEQVVWASENAAALSSPRTAWKEVDLSYDRMFSYDRSRQPHPPAGCVVLPVISHNIYQQGTGITRPAILMLHCRERIDLLRPAWWVRSRLRAQNRQGYLLVSMPEMGIMGVQAHVIAVRSSAFNPAIVTMKSASSRPVIGLFIHHTTNVRQYTFKDTLTDKIDTIRATPNHPFYVVNQQRYIPVSHLSTHDRLVNILGHPVTIVCSKGKTRHCGRPYHSGQVIRVYNLEVYGQHRYFVGKAGIMVHNGYDCPYEGCKRVLPAPSKLKRHIRTHTGEKPFVCKECDKRFKDPSNLKRHVKTHTGEKPFACEVCSKNFTRNRDLQRHFQGKRHIAVAERQRAQEIPAEPSSVASGSSKETEQTARKRSRSALPQYATPKILIFYK